MYFRAKEEEEKTAQTVVNKFVIHGTKNLSWSLNPFITVQIVGKKSQKHEILFPLLFAKCTTENKYFRKKQHTNDTLGK